MITLSESRNAWGMPQFDATLKQELEALPVDQLPLQHCLEVGNHALDEKRSVMILSVADDNGAIRVKFGVFFSSIIAGCSCDNDPTPIDAVNEYCELWLTLDKQTGRGEISLAD